MSASVPPGRPSTSTASPPVVGPAYATVALAVWPTLTVAGEPPTGEGEARAACAVTVERPGARPARVCERVRCWLKLAGPVTSTSAPVPPGRPLMVTARLQVVGGTE